MKLLKIHVIYRKSPLRTCCTCVQLKMMINKWAWHIIIANYVCAMYFIQLTIEWSNRVHRLATLLHANIYTLLISGALRSVSFAGSIASFCRFEPLDRCLIVQNPAQYSLTCWTGLTNVFTHAECSGALNILWSRSRTTYIDRITFVRSSRSLLACFSHISRRISIVVHSNEPSCLSIRSQPLSCNSCAPASCGSINFVVFCWLALFVLHSPSLLSKECPIKSRSVTLHI